jgi:hypothetical protein
MKVDKNAKQQGLGWQFRVSQIKVVEHKGLEVNGEQLN